MNNNVKHEAPIKAWAAVHRNQMRKDGMWFKSTIPKKKIRVRRQLKPKFNPTSYLMRYWLC
tara:strand:- start:1529 stop:1711 length:183 start_codon:yes stop_codon:yes gene_type:complete